MNPKRSTDRWLAWLLAIVDVGRWLAPASRRREWRRQWRADIWHEWRWLQRDDAARLAELATLVARVMGAWRHAWQLRRHVRQLEMISQDLRYGWRALVRTPGFTAVAVATLALGIGVNTTIFTLMNAVLLRPLAAREPDRVVRIVARSGTGAAGAAARRFSYADLADFRARATTVEDLSGVNLATFVLAADNRSDQLIGEIASGRYLTLRNARAAVGRMLVDTDDASGAPPVAVISDPLWRRRFGGEPVLGRSILLNGSSYTIVGVADPSLVGSFIAAPVDVWVPIGSSGRALGHQWETDRSVRTLVVMGRLRPGVSFGQAKSELQSIATSLAREFTPDLKPTIDVVPGTIVFGDQRRLAQIFLSMLLGVVALVLIVAAANVGNMLLARLVERRRELAIRVALGASRAHLARMLAVESVIIAAAGGAGALLLAAWTSRAFANITPLPNLTLRLDLRTDARVVGFTVVAAVAAAVVLSLAGALQAAKSDVAPALKDAPSAAGRPRRVRGALAAIQITVSLMLLIGAGLFARSASRAAALELGFDTRGVVVTDVDAAGGRSNAEGLRFFDEVVRRLRAVPGVEAAAVSTRAPLDSSTPLVRIDATAPPADSAPTASFLVIGQEFFDVVRTPIVSGRAFDDRDTERAPAAAIVNETLAARLWPDGSALGRRLWLEAAASPVPCTIVGIAKNSKYLTLGEEGQSHVYLPFAQRPRRGMSVLVRATNADARMASTMQDVLHAVDPNVHGFFTRTLAEHVSVSLLPVRLAARLTLVVAALAGALAMVGLYSLVSFLVAERTHEIGLRRALGADSTAVLRLVLTFGLKLAAGGLAVGIPIALVSTRVLGSLLYGVSPVDPVVFTLMASALLAVAALACLIPAVRAMRVDPLTALRQP
jgi:putative ABC transport system permease protein